MIHRLVQAAVRAEPTSGHDSRIIVLALLEADLPAEIMDLPESWPRWAHLLTHVLAATARKSSQDLDDDSSSAAAWLLDRAGTYLQVQGRAGEAAGLMRKAVQIDESTYGPDDPRVAVDLSNLATVLTDLGDAAGARPLLERALRID